MTDRELLELAAVAAGLNVGTDEGAYDDLKWWNPLQNDGDALRLAASLEMVVDTYSNCAALSSSFMDGQGDWTYGHDYKHAIVLLAAEIGKAMK